MISGAPKVPRRILIVDDADEPRAILAIALRTINGTMVETANDAEDALRRMTTNAVDVLVTDVRMRGMTGLELLAKLRERSCWPSCGAVVISGEPDPDLPVRARACGANLFFRKPFSVGVVRQSVLSLLEECDGKA
jgi:DNA-binding NtrC family response regulator